MISLEAHLRSRRDEGRKLLVPYVTAGARADWLDVVRAVALAGADAVEIGIPFSDPVMDGPVIQAASQLALERGTTPPSILNEVGAATIDIPLAAMTYYNLVYRFGLERFADGLAASGISGAIVPDLPMEEAGPWQAAARRAEIETVMLVAPNTPDERMRRICEFSAGFVYAIGLLGVTGERRQLAASASRVGERIKAVTDKPVLIGIGISTPEQAAAASVAADGVIVGSALVRRILDGESPEQIADFVASLRAGLDG